MRSQVYVRSLFSIFSILVALTPAHLWGQGASQGAITGTVSDSTGAVVAGAEMTATNPATNFKLVATSNESGSYSLSPLPVGRYQVATTLAGFKTFRQEPVVVSTALTTHLDVRLEVGEMAQTVEVTGTPPPLQTDTAELSTVVERDVIDKIPLQLSGNNVGSSGRRQVDSFVFLTPGVIGDQFSKFVNGSPNLMSEVIIDGISASNAIVPGVVGNFGPPFEAVEEFNVQNNLFPAEFSRGFGVTNFTMKSGTNNLHGDAFWFVRNDKFDARGFFNTTKPVIRQHEFGGTVGGPIKKDKTFFFASFSRFSVRGGAINRSLVTLPTPQMKQGDFSQVRDPNGNLIQIFDPATTRPDGQGGFVRDPFPGNIIPAGRISEVATRVVDLIPDPEFPGFFDNFLAKNSQPTTDWTWSAKVDHALSTRQKLSVSYWWDRTDLPRIYELGPGQFLDNGWFQRERGGGIRINHDFLLSPNLVQHFGVGYGRRQSDFIPFNETIGNLTFKIPHFPDALGVPQFNIAGFPALGNAANVSYPDAANNYFFVDNVSWIRGKHSIKFGVDYRRQGDNQLAGGGAAGIMDFNNLYTSQPNSPDSGVLGHSFASFLLGQVDTVNVIYGAGRRGWRVRYFGTFIQDEFKISPKLTINYGLRYEIPLPVFEVADRLSALDLGAANPGAGGRRGALAFAGDGPGRCNCRTFAKTNYRHFAPRFGIAYGINDKTVLRLGYGVYFATGNANVVDGFTPQLFRTGFEYPFFATSTNSGITPAFVLDQGPQVTVPSLPSLDPTLANNGTIDYFNADGGKMPLNQSWTLSLQRHLPGDLFVDIAYLGQKTSRLPSNLETLNQVPSRFLSLGSLLQTDINSPEAAAAGIALPYPGFSGSVAQALRPFPQFQDVTNNIQPNGQSSHHAMHLKIQKRYSHGFSYLVAYTASKTLTDSRGNSGYSAFLAKARDTENRRLEKGLAPQDIPHNLVGSYTYELPMGPGKRFLNRGVGGKILGGWGIAGTSRYASGSPLSISGGTPLGFLFAGSNRPDRILGESVRTSVKPGEFDPAKDTYLNINAFKASAPFTFGTGAVIEPNTRGFAFYNEDISIIKLTPIKEQKSIEFRMEMFNVFNRTLFSNPRTSINSPFSFGKVSGQRNSPRVIQFALKIHF